jgi:hypothetical protein
MVKIVARFASALLFVSCVAMIAAPPATAAPSLRSPAVSARASERAVPAFAGDLAGYTWSANEPLYNFNGQVGTINVSRISNGVYDVTFGNLGALAAGMVQVTPYNDKGTCSVTSWGPSGSSPTDFTAGVDCYSLAGHPQDTFFDLIMTEPETAPPGTYDYAWVWKQASSGTLVGPYQYNSAGMSNKVKHLGTGRYQVTFGGPASSGTHGTVKVSPYGAGPGDCAASGWHGTSAGQVVDVNCYLPSGRPVNRRFDVTYAGRTNLMGLAGFPTVNALIGATGRVMTQFDSLAGAHVTVSHTGLGAYNVQLNGTTEQFGGGDVQISPITVSRNHCVVADWSGGNSVKTVVAVRCFNSHGSPVNSAFTVQFVEAFLA